MKQLNQVRTTEEKLYRAGWFLLVLFFVLFFCAQHGVTVPFLQKPCLFRTLTGYYCPGCGGRSSVRALLQGRFLVCAADYPLTAYAAFLYIWFMVSHTVERISRGRFRVGLRWRVSYLWIALGILLAHTLIKNLISILFGITPFLS